MKVILENHTPWPLETLIWTKGTRLQADGVTLDDVIRWPEEKKAMEWEYMKGTIQSSWEFFQLIFSIHGVTRAFTHQLVRHRIGTSFAQQTQRVVDLSEFANIPGPSVLASQASLERWDAAMDYIADSYSDLVDMGVKRQDARGIIPTNVSTNIIFGANLRTLHEMAKIRLCVKAQGEFQDVFREIRRVVVSRWPWTEDVIQVQCGLTGTCAFPTYPTADCPVKPYVYNPETGRAYDGGTPRTLRVLRATHALNRAEAQPVAPSPGGEEAGGSSTNLMASEGTGGAGDIHNLLRGDPGKGWKEGEER